MPPTATAPIDWTRLWLQIGAILVFASGALVAVSGKKREQVPPSLPKFKYHPDPVSTGHVVHSEKECKCCGKKRGYAYVGPVYSKEELRNELCPWCISDGCAARKYGAWFTGGVYPGNVPESVKTELFERTPGYVSWQGNDWLSHCDDACAYLGDATKEDLAAILKSHQYVMDDEDLSETAEDAPHYQPKGSPAYYKFQCLRCGELRYRRDFD